MGDSVNHEGVLNAGTIKYIEREGEATSQRASSLVFAPTCSCGWIGQPETLKGPAVESLMRHIASKRIASTR